MKPLSCVCWVFAIVASHATSVAEQQPVALSLADCINLSLEENLSLQRSMLRTLIGENEVTAAEGAYGVTLDGRLSGRSNVGAMADKTIYQEVTSSESVSGSLSLGYTFLDGGLRNEKLEQAKDNLLAVEMDYDRDRQELLFEVTSLYLRGILNARQVDIQLKELEVTRMDLERITLDFENGIRTESEVLRQRATVAENERQLAERRRVGANSIISLKAVLNLPLLLELVLPQEEILWLENEDLSDLDLHTSLKQIDDRSDILAQAMRVQSAQRGVTISEKGDHFTVSGSADLSSNYSNAYNRYGFSAQILERSPSLGVGVSLNVPILDRSRTRTTIIRSRLQLRQTELDQLLLEQNAKSRLLQSAQDFDSARAKLAASQAQFRAAEDALEAERFRYEAGVATLLDLSTLQNSRLSAALGVEEARYELFSSRLQVSLEDGSIEAFLVSRLGQQISM